MYDSIFTSMPKYISIHLYEFLCILYIYEFLCILYIYFVIIWDVCVYIYNYENHKFVYMYIFDAIMLLGHTLQFTYIH